MAQTTLTEELRPVVPGHIRRAVDRLTVDGRAVKAEMIKAGASWSSAVVMWTYKAAESVFIDNARLLYDDLLDQAKHAMGDQLSADAGEVQQIVSTGLENMAESLRALLGQFVPVVPGFEDTTLASRERFEAVIAEAMQEYRSRALREAKRSTMTNTINTTINAPVGALAIGNNNNAQGTQTIGLSGDDIGKAILALRDLRTALNASHLSDTERAAANANLDALQAEVVSGTRTPGAAMQALEGLSTTVQGLAAAQEAGNTVSAAWDALKLLLGAA